MELASRVERRAVGCPPPFARCGGGVSRGGSLVAGAHERDTLACRVQKSLSHPGPHHASSLALPLALHSHSYRVLRVLLLAFSLALSLAYSLALSLAQRGAITRAISRALTRALALLRTLSALSATPPAPLPPPSRLVAVRACAALHAQQRPHLPWKFNAHGNSLLKIPNIIPVINHQLQKCLVQPYFPDSNKFLWRVDPKGENPKDVIIVCDNAKVRSKDESCIC